MARKAAKKQIKASTGAAPSGEVEASVIALAEQLGTFLGQVTAKTEGWLDQDMLRDQATMIRDGAAEVLKRVNSAGASARQAVASAAKAVRPAAPPEEPKARPSRGAVDAPGKKHRKPPPQQKVGRGTTEPMGKRQGLKTYKVGSGRRG